MVLTQHSLFSLNIIIKNVEWARTIAFSCAHRIRPIGAMELLVLVLTLTVRVRFLHLFAHSLQLERKFSTLMILGPTTILQTFPKINIWLVAAEVNKCHYQVLRKIQWPATFSPKNQILHSYILKTGKNKKNQILLHFFNNHSTFRTNITLVKNVRIPLALLWTNRNLWEN